MRARHARAPRWVLAVLLWASPALAQHHGHHDTTQEPPAPTPAEDHSGHQRPAAPLPPHIPPVTDEDRQAAFPDVRGHTVHDDAINFFVLGEQLEWRGDRRVSGFAWDMSGWVGKDIDRVWFRTEGDLDADRVEHAEVQVLYGRAVTRWWDVVAGVRQDLRPGSPQTWAAFGVQGLAPYWFEVEATAFVSPSGRTHLRLETEYDVLLTNRLILQPVVEVDVYGRDDIGRGIGAGLSSADVGLRLRYERRRELAPYVGVTWGTKFFGTADMATAAGDRTSGARLTVGVRAWM